jgi:hypothetical protein
MINANIVDNNIIVPIEPPKLLYPKYIATPIAINPPMPEIVKPGNTKNSKKKSRSPVKINIIIVVITD